MVGQALRPQSQDQALHGQVAVVDQVIQEPEQVEQVVVEQALLEL
jgi:hypothetical protein